MHRWWIILGLCVGLVLTGCDNPEPKPAPSPFGFPKEPTQAQPQLPTIKLYVGAEELVTELAIGALEHQTGMMFRTNMAENAAMLFVFPYPQRVGFWMKNTSVPLSAAYIASDGTILEIHDLHPHNTNTVASRSLEIQYVLEVNQGWFERHKITTGAVIRTDQGSLADALQKGNR